MRMAREWHVNSLFLSLLSCYTLPMRYRIYWEAFNAISPDSLAYGTFRGTSQRPMIRLAEQLIRLNVFSPISPLGVWYLIDLSDHKLIRSKTLD